MNVPVCLVNLMTQDQVVTTEDEADGAPLMTED